MPNDDKLTKAQKAEILNTFKGFETFGLVFEFKYLGLL